MRSRWTIGRGRAWVATLVAGLAVGVAPHAAQAQGGKAKCTTAQVPVSVPDVPGATLHGELCAPKHGANTVHLLVHGGTYDHNYWDFPYKPSRYSYVERANKAGHATFNVDRLGAGTSTRPASSLVTPANGNAALHDVVGKLRSGAIGGRAFSKVVWVGHSVGSRYAWLYAAEHQDIDAYVLTGAVHHLKPSAGAEYIARVYPAAMDPKFANEPWAGDLGYLTTRPDARSADVFYHAPGTDPAVPVIDEQLKSTGALPEIQSLGAITGLPPAEAPSQAMTVPVLVLLGEFDKGVCGGSDGLTCTQASIAAHEAAYYANVPRLDVEVVPDTAHNIQLHRSANTTTKGIMRWLDARGL
jgi:pimeloyl-ACP methyl ester carboxylesterase